MRNTDVDLITRLRQWSDEEWTRHFSIGERPDVHMLREDCRKAADKIGNLLPLLARKLCNCGPYLETDLSHHADYCVYRMEMEELEGARHGE